VTHQDERHSREVRMVIERIAALLHANAGLFRGRGRQTPP